MATPISPKTLSYKASYFISKRLRSGSAEGFSALIIKIAIASIALGLGVMIVSYSIFSGFKTTIKEKIFSFSAHIQISKFDDSSAYEETPVALSANVFAEQDEMDWIEHVQVYSRKAGLLKTDEEILGVLFKGIGEDYKAGALKEGLTDGEFPVWDSEKRYNKEVVISQIIADKLKLKVGDKVAMFFVQDPPRSRKLTVAAIYETGIEEFDGAIILGDIRLVQRLNSWEYSLVGGFELFVKDFDELDIAFDSTYDFMDHDLQISKVTEQHASYFDWFIMLNKNVLIFLAIILSVASFNIVSIILILIMERTSMIGTLKAIGATNWQIQQVFIFNGARLIAYGLLLGNVFGIGLCLVQKYLKIMPLDPENYYMDTVPIQFEWEAIIAFNAMTALLVSLILFIPTFVVSRINPIKSIKFS